ncbi:MAG: GAF domain-containing protein, partial [Chloroflexi bacterium]|nr:GAF domain-containing protein [Chloroflexota bacterium]
TSSILNLDELLPQSAELVRARFNLYYVGIFLTDEAERWAVLRAGTGDAAQQMLDKGHKLKIGAASMISQCITQQQARIALDVGEEAVRFDNPLLPLTRSELALPLISRGRIIGAVTIQSDQSAAFTPDDVTVLQTMADQISNAIENARLYEQSTAALQEVDALNRRLTGEGWETYLRRGSDRPVIWAGDDETIAPAALTAADEQLSAGQIVVEPATGGTQESVVSVPVMLRGQAIGALRIAMPEAAYTDELRATLESLAGHVAQAAENARLLDETQARFARERALGAATDKMRSRSEVEQILQTAAEELAHYLQASAIKVRLGSSVTAAGETA